MITSTLETARLVLRRFRPTDLEPFWAIGPTDFEVARWLTGLSWPPLKSEAEAFVQNACSADVESDSFPFAIELSGALIGGVEVQKPGDLNEFPELPTIGYWLSSKTQGQGYMLEACVAALHWGFAREACGTFAARVFQANSPSQNLLKKLGFKEAGRCIRFSRSLQKDIPNLILHLPKDRFEALHGEASIVMGAA